MNYLKGASARRIFQRLPSIKLDAHINSFWQAKYGYKPVSPAGEHGVRDYIRTQWDRLEKYVR